MRTRLAGAGLILLGIAFAVFFVYLPVRNGGEQFNGLVSIKALVFVPLAVVTGLAFVLGGPPVLAAFQSRAKTRRQTTLVLSVIIGSGIFTALGYWQIESRWLREPAPAILKVPAMHVPPPRSN